ncbi:MAG TPA: tetratricopeptide repeat protein [Thermoanaerobaculia bacterium]|nr:tetratricopeptide repeat protein [Thermoanaerobaculia bacterium]
MRPARLGVPAALVLAGACALAYANGLTGTFVYDDKAIVRDNFRIRSPETVDELFTTQYFGGPPGSGTSYRPILLLSFAVQWWIHGADPVGFHAVNLALHIAVTLLLARLWLRVGLPPPVAAGAALLFAALPIHVEAVTGIVGRGETLAALFVLASLLLALGAADARSAVGRAVRYAGALALYAFANLTKESAVVAPALLFLLLAFVADGGLAVRSRSALRRGWPYYAGGAAVLLGVFRVRHAVLGGAIHARLTGIFEVENPLAPLPAGARAANACLVLFRYVARMALPLRLSSDESAWSIRPVGPRELVFWAAPIVLAALAVAAVAGLRRRSPTALGFLFLVLAWLPASNLLFPTGTIFAERLAYLPSAGFCLAAASWIAGSAPSFASLSRARAAILASLALAYAARALARNPVWQSDEALFTDMVRVSPRSAKAHYDFAYMSADHERWRPALEHYEKAIEIYPRYWDAWAGKGRAERALGETSASEKSYAKSLEIVSTYENGFYGLGLAREDRGDRRGAEEAYRSGLRYNPQSLPLAYRLALLFSAEGRPSTLYAWRRALAIAPGNLPTRLGYADWLASAGRRDEALAQVRETLRRGPRYKPALEKLAELER